MSLIIKGFKKQNIVSIDALTELIKRVPKTHLQGLNTVVYDPYRFYQRSYTQPRPVNYRVAGEYDSAPIDHIAIYKFRDRKEFSHILYHEIGHHVFKRCLDSVKRKEWVTKVYPNSEHVSEYAKTNASEDFAETYAFYITNPANLASLPDKLKFMQKWLPI